MGIRLEDYLAKLPADERAAIAQGAARLIEQEATLRQLRESCGLTQQDVGEALGVRPAAVSKAERRDDVSVHTLRRHVRAMGGELYLVAKIPGRPPVQLKGFGRGSKEGRDVGQEARSGATIGERSSDGDRPESTDA